MKQVLILGPKCFSSPLGMCYSHTYYIVGLPLWLARWFVNRFVTSTCTRSGTGNPYRAGESNTEAGQ